MQAFNDSVSLAELTSVEPFAHGGFCIICSCVYRGQQAVLKITKPASSSSRGVGAVEDLLREISIYRQISQRGGHPNIVRSYGAGYHLQPGDPSPTPFLLLEKLDGGTLESAFERSTSMWSDPTGRLPVAIELADALVFLHGSAIPGAVVLHRDLKPSNIGLCGQGHVKVFDLGLSVVRQVLGATTTTYEMSGMAGSKRFMAPEVCAGLSYNEKVDVYSFALVLWQICALRKPFAGMSEADHYREVVQGGLRPPLDARWSPALIRLLQACWHVHPDARPTMLQARDSLRQICAFGGGVMKGMAADGMDASFMDIFGEFLEGYSKCAIMAGTTPEQFQFNLGTLIKMVPENMKKPYEFELFHASSREPVDLYTWGNDFFRPLIELDKSKLAGKENLAKIAEYLANGENVFLMSNHQTEADPQVMSLLMEREGYGEVASQLINVAGHRVTTDPLAIPFSMGRNLFCIFSKKYMENPPEQKGQKQKHNVRTLKKMAEMMSEGGQFIWVAPSGGRDRPDPETGKFVVSPYDPKSVEVFRLMAAKARGREKTGPVTHFFPFAMWTNKLVPPPDQVNKELGERRQADRGPASIAFGDEVLPAPGAEALKKTEFIAMMEERVRMEYAKLDEFHEKEVAEQ